MSNNSRKSHCNIQHTITTHTEKATTQNNNDHARPDKAVTRHTNINTKTASKTQSAEELLIFTSGAKIQNSYKIVEGVKY